MNIYYCHGFASRFDPGSSKLAILRELGPVYGHDIDYTQPADEVVRECIDKLIGAGIDLVVGTSMGVWLASTAGSPTGIPFVAINPAIEPHRRWQSISARVWTTRVMTTSLQPRR